MTRADNTEGRIPCPRSCNPPGSHVVGWAGHDQYEDCECRGDDPALWGTVLDPGQEASSTTRYAIVRDIVYKDRTRWENVVVEGFGFYKDVAVQQAQAWASDRYPEFQNLRVRAITTTYVDTPIEELT